MWIAGGGGHVHVHLLLCTVPQPGCAGAHVRTGRLTAPWPVRIRFCPVVHSSLECSLCLLQMRQHSVTSSHIPKPPACGNSQM